MLFRSKAAVAEPNKRTPKRIRDNIIFPIRFIAHILASVKKIVWPLPVSYSPLKRILTGKNKISKKSSVKRKEQVPGHLQTKEKLTIGVTGFEPATSRPPAVRSDQTEPYPAEKYYNRFFQKGKTQIEIFSNFLCRDNFLLRFPLCLLLKFLHL